MSRRRHSPPPPSSAAPQRAVIPTARHPRSRAANAGSVCRRSRLRFSTRSPAHPASHRARPQHAPHAGRGSQQLERRVRAPRRVVPRLVVVGRRKAGSGASTARVEGQHVDAEALCAELVADAARGGRRRRRRRAPVRRLAWSRRARRASATRAPRGLRRDGLRTPPAGAAWSHGARERPTGRLVRPHRLEPGVRRRQCAGEDHRRQTGSGAKRAPHRLAEQPGDLALTYSISRLLLAARSRTSAWLTTVSPPPTPPPTTRTAASPAASAAGSTLSMAAGRAAWRRRRRVRRGARRAPRSRTLLAPSSAPRSTRSTNPPGVRTLDPLPPAAAAASEPPPPPRAAAGANRGRARGGGSDRGRRGVGRPRHQRHAGIARIGHRRVNRRRNAAASSSPASARTAASCDEPNGWWRPPTGRQSGHVLYQRHQRHAELLGARRGPG